MSYDEIVEFKLMNIALSNEIKGMAKRMQRYLSSVVQLKEQYFSMRKFLRS